jgi:hypothetical protein
MQKDRSQRFQSALDMARALSAAMGDGGAPQPPTPISRLPDVPSVWMPMQPATKAGPLPPDHGVAPATVVTAPPAPEIMKGPGGTLASRAGRQVSEPPPQIAIVGVHGTLPSENLPMLSSPGASAGVSAARGVAMWIVVLLVFGALAAGFLLGFATARTL